MKKTDMEKLLQGFKVVLEESENEKERVLNRLKELQDEIEEKEHQLFMLDCMKKQITESLKTNREELKELEKEKAKMKTHKKDMSIAELKQLKYEKEQQNLRLIVKPDKTEEDYKMMKQLDKEIKEVIRLIAEKTKPELDIQIGSQEN
jgi:hypothetical protein